MSTITSDRFFKELEHSPKLLLYLEQMQTVVAEERKKRERFRDEIREHEKGEFINGEVIMHSPVQIRHNVYQRNLIMLFTSFVEKHSLGFVGFETVLIELTRNDYEPDLLFYGNAKAAKILPDQRISPAPDFIVEILSPSTEKNDRGVKFEDYAAHDIGEYWIIDPEKETLEQYLLRDGTYELALKSGSGDVRSVAVEGFVIPIRAIFDKAENLRTVRKLLS